MHGRSRALGAEFPPTEADPPASAARAFLSCMAVVLCVRAIVFAVGVYSVWTAQDWEFTEHAPRHPWIAWDTYAYRHVMLHGYEPGRVPQTAAYFPLYPLMCRPLIPLLGPELAMLVVANACSLAAFVMLFLFAHRVAGPGPAWWCTVLAATYPASSFLCAAYTEGPFLLFGATALWLMARGNTWPAAVASGLACATRPTGLAIAAAVVFWEAARLLTAFRSTAILRLAAIAVVACSGMLAYEGYLWHRYGRPDAFFLAQTQFGPLRNESRRGELNLVSVDPGKDSLWPMQARARPSPIHSSSPPGAFGGRAVYLLRRTAAGWDWVGTALVIGLSLFGLFHSENIPRAVFLVAPVMLAMGLGRVPFEALARYFTGALACMALPGVWASKYRQSAALWLLAAGMLFGQLVLAYSFSRGFWCG